MALIGSGTYDIPNVVTTAVWRAVDVDAGLTAIAEQLGGVSFVAGTPVISAGNLTAANFGAGMLLGAEYLAQKRHYSALTVSTEGTPSASASVYYYASAATDLDIFRVSFGGPVVAATATAYSGSVAVYVNGSLLVTVPVDVTPNAASTTFVTYDAAVVSRLKAGDVISLSCAGLSGFESLFVSPVLTILGKGGLTA